MEHSEKKLTEGSGTESAKLPGRRSHHFAAGLALILSLSALMLGAYLWYFSRGPGNTIDSDFITIVEQVNRLEQSLSDRISKLETQSSESQEARKIIEQSIDRLRVNLGRDQTNWAISESEHLLIIANNRLHLARDIKTAIAALQGADYQLQLLAQPKFLAVRKIIAGEISSLESLDKIDIPGMSIRLSTLANKVNDLPVSTGSAKTVSETRVIENKTEKKKSVFSEFWQDLLSLVRIRNNVEQYKPLLSAEHSYFIRENLRLRLFGCQQALLASNDIIYKQTLADSLGWIKQNFDTDSQAVISAMAELEKLAKINIELSLPDISGSLEKIRELRTSTGVTGNTTKSP